MAKPLEDHGHAIVASKPIKPQVRQSSGRGDPVQLAGCVIVVCDPHDANSLHLEISDGSRWRRLKFADEESAAALVPTAPTLDLEAIKREVVNAAIAQMPQPAMKVIAPATHTPSEDVRAIAQGLLENADHVSVIAEKLVDIEARLDFIEQRALARAELS